jgi:hypothetical protein
VRGIAGAIVGGIAGYYLFHVLAKRGMFGYAIPGAAIGLVAGLLAGGRSRLLGIVCVVASLCVTIVAEWVHAPFRQDPGLAYFVTHLHQLDNLGAKALITALGAACAYWLGQGR